MQAIAEFEDLLHSMSHVGHHPVSIVRWVPMATVSSNQWNPNTVAKNEMQLLYTSIKADGYTQPVVVVEHDEKPGHYVVIDGFHRYTIMRTHEDIRDSTGGLIPVVVLDIPMNDRMASTIRHNRARGKHAIAGMSTMVYELLDNGWSDSQICQELGMEADELLKLKHITGFSKRFEDAEYRLAWESRKQIRNKIWYQERYQKILNGDKYEGHREAYTLDYLDRVRMEQLRDDARSRGDESNDWLEQFKEEKREAAAIAAGRA